MTVVKFPTKLPPPDRIDLPQAHFCVLLQNLSGLFLARANELMRASNAAELATVVREIEKDTAEASAGWAAVSKAIRDSWGI